jgi:hypothetical protein
MKTDEIKALTESVNELNESCVDLAQALKATARTAEATKKLWRSKNSPILIKIGLALIAFPDPTITDIVGGALVAAGTVQAGIRRRTLYVEDVFKTFGNTFKELRSIKESV